MTDFASSVVNKNIENIDKDTQDRIQQSAQKMYAIFSEFDKLMSSGDGSFNVNCDDTKKKRTEVMLKDITDVLSFVQGSVIKINCKSRMVDPTW